MKAKVLKRFRDKHNGKVYNVGATLWISKERFEEIKKKDASLVEEVKEEKNTEK